MIELGRTEEVIREMDKLANEDHTHIATEEELNVYRSNWWIRSNFVGSDTMPIRHRPDFKEALSTLRQPCVASRMQRIKLITKIGGKVLPHHGGTGKIPGGILHLSITATMDPVPIARGNLLNSDWANYSWNDFQKLIWCTVTVTNSVTANAVYCHRRGV